MILIDFLVTACFFGFLFWAFWPRYRFVSASKATTGLVTIAVQRYVNFPFTNGEALVYASLDGGPWFSTLDHNDGEKADYAMDRRLDSFLAFAKTTGQLKIEADEAEDQSCEAASCGC
jgi:hypothetical protein